MIRKISNIYDLLEIVEKRKAMFLGNDYTFHSFNSFITGYTIGCNENQLETEKHNHFSDFSIWILGHLPKHFGQAGGWYWQISNRNPDNDENAFKEFFEFLEIFKTAKKKVERIEIEKFEFDISEYSTKKKVEIDKREVVDRIHKITIEHSKVILIKGFNKDNLTYDRWCLSEKEYDEIITNLNKIKIIELKN